MHTQELAAWLHHFFASRSMLYVYVILVLLAETAAIGFLRAYSLSGGVLWLFAGLCFYFLVCIFFELSLRYERMGIVNILWSAFSVIFVVATGVFLFDEQISLLQLLGIGLIISGLIFLRSGKKTRAV